MLLLSGIGILFTRYYYKRINSAEDPGTMEARARLSGFDRLMKEGKYADGLSLLDSVEAVYSSIPCYPESYEMGVVYNNRGSARMALALYQTGDSVLRSELLKHAESEIRWSILLYEAWKRKFDTMTTEMISSFVSKCFAAREHLGNDMDYQRILNKRVEDIELARVEVNRRISVSYSNLGIIQRHLYQQDSALVSYVKALKLWKRNPTAKNNLNTLLGRPQEEGSLIEQLFPPERKTPD